MKLELWGGVECTVVKVGAEYRDQIKETGHAHRAGDLHLIRQLGIQTLRYPVLWETVAPTEPLVGDWAWSDKQLSTLRDLGIDVIAGFIHHGSGPRYTNLLDPLFPEELAVFAEQVARRYPWVTKFTPINEPLTTARFSYLYGHWHPHLRDETSFFRAIVNQCRGVALAMRAIRRVNPLAQLVQTEDLGRIFSCEQLNYQADYENERRWLSLDLLAGRVKPRHPFFKTMVDHGVPIQHLEELQRCEGAPDLIGINHYATSDRYLDSDTRRYPDCFAGANSFEPYADVEALRVDLPHAELGAAARLAEAWVRYKRPLAITEAHHGSTRDEQVRWLAEVWRDAEGLKQTGVDVRAVTIWSLFGAIDWNSLLMRKDGFYETGAFDIRSGTPRRTALGQAAEELARCGAISHPVLDQPGWWKRECRFYQKREPVFRSTGKRPLLVFGSTGTLGKAFLRICAMRGLHCHAVGRAEADISNADEIESAISKHKPWAVVNAAGYVRVADASREADLCFQSNVTGAANIARACALAGLQYVTFSSDLVFDGTLGRAYVEHDELRPLCVYGSSKQEAERQVTSVHPDTLLIRTSAFFGPWDSANFVWQSLRHLSDGRDLSVNSASVSPTYVPDLVNATLDLLIDRESGVWHLANNGVTSWGNLAERAARHAGISWSAKPECDATAARSTALGSVRGILLPKLDDALTRFFKECEVSWTSGA